MVKIIYAILSLVCLIVGTYYTVSDNLALSTPALVLSCYCLISYQAEKILERLKNSREI